MWAVADITVATSYVLIQCKSKRGTMKHDFFSDKSSKACYKLVTRYMHACSEVQLYNDWYLIGCLRDIWQSKTHL